MPRESNSSLREAAFRFVLIMGVVNLFADMTYEGGASINGPFLGSLGASAAAVSIIAGLGEFLGYSIRSISGYVSDKSGKYWMLTFTGYTINLLAVPALALAGGFWAAAGLVLAERIGRAIRKPTVEAMLSYTTQTLGRGWVYALNSALDETGATLGPLMVAGILWWKGDYRLGYALLLIPAFLTLGSLTVARSGFPTPSNLEPVRGKIRKFSRSYWLYMLAGSLFAAGLMSFEFISYHLSSTGIVTGHWIPMFLALSTVAGIIASLVLGKLYDRIGLPVLIGAVLVSCLFSPLVFRGGFFVALGGLVLWGVGYATQDTLLKAVIAGVLPEGHRSFAFGLFYIGYGTGWLAGSIIAGYLYSRSHLLLIAFSIAIQIMSVPAFIVAQHFENEHA